MLWGRCIVLILRFSVNSNVATHQLAVAPSARRFSGLQHNPSTRLLLQKSSRQQAPDVHVNPRRHLHPLFVLLAQKLIKGVAILTGRGFRKWWISLPPNKRQRFAQQLRNNRGKITIGLGITGGLAAAYYVTHLQRTPITNRLRFIAFNDDQMRKITEFQNELEVQQLKMAFCQINHPYVCRVKAVAERLLEGNRDLPQIHDKTWTVCVVNTPQQNAFVLPNGHIYVFRGMIDLCHTDDELGCIIAHEMAHAVLNHCAENMSHAHFIDFCVILLLAGLWAVMPSDGIAVITQWFFNKVIDLMLHLPYSRKLETEADIVGLELAAKACFDIRHSSTFWIKMAMMRELKNQEEIPEFLSTHPADETRGERLDAQMADALKKRLECQCPPLPPRDPRLMIAGLRHQIKAAKNGSRKLPKMA
ncbi:metalloendopeptidase OMA1 [Tropilaelaps mercedesae]|uniref:Metalloendopeptidase OMA1, mitochondrial n=1 Tax=Tropilaelaps mercedesae TaxID=418985 RepID=A0A1V9XJB3_9ACAR|nr:metalloendopeptidase OMA1 [Tropilaelaps mercedesae]